MLLFFTDFLISCNAQKSGYVVVNNNDTIKGKFKLTVSPKASAYNTPEVFILYTSKDTRTNISTDSIEKINVTKGKKLADSYIIYDNAL